MSEVSAGTLFPLAGDGADYTTGILPCQSIRSAIARNEILAPDPIPEEQIQPASLDLRLGDTAWRVRASFLAGPNATVRDKIEALATHAVDLRDGGVLEKDCIYIVPLLEMVDLPRKVSAIANPKSSTGRLDIFARVIVDRGTAFDRVPERYQGPLYVEIAPHAFPIRVRRGSRLVQLRLKRGSPTPSDKALRDLQQTVGLVEAGDGEPQIRRGLAFTVDVRGEGEGSVIGYRARRNAGLIDVDLRAHYPVAEFWEPVMARPGGGLILDPHDFYILASRESVSIPASHAAEMLAYDTSVGEFRVHYAGFFDPGFGLGEAGGTGTRAVLEVRAHEVPFLIEDGQTVGRLIYERLTARPDKLYGAGIGSNYQRQGLALSKHFRP